MAGIIKHSVQVLNDWAEKRRIKRHTKQIEHVEPDYSTIFAGKWAFIDPNTKREHVMEITNKLTIKIDGNLLDGHIIGLSSDLMTFLDHYGFQLKVFAKNHHPSKIFDDSTGETYEVINKSDSVPSRD